MSFVVAALYKFVGLPDYKTVQGPLLEFCLQNDIKGTLLLAHEGINGTVAGSRESIDALLSHLKSDTRLVDLTHKESLAEEMPFYRMKVKLKKEIVTLGVEDIDPTHVVGTYVEPQQWNDLISDPDVLVVDTRNDYEVELGTFSGAVNPNTASFREFPAYVERELDPGKQKKVAMFCTGGIRCEKSTALLKQMGFDQVYHLKGGILQYLEDVPQKDSLWQGECFVFDNRVSVDHDLQPGTYDLCHGCRRPITDADKASEKYVEGVACPRCHDELTEDQWKRFSERQKQVQLSRERQQTHIGAPPPGRQVKDQGSEDIRQESASK